MKNNEIYINTNKRGISQEVPKLEAVFAKELTAGMAHQYITSLVGKLGGIEQGYDQFIEKGKRLHYSVGKDIYGPLIIGYCQWLTSECQKLDYHGNVFFALRDAAPLEVAAKELWKYTRLKTVGIYANRPLLGVEDEISPEESREDGKVITYLEKKGIYVQNKVVWADTGAWGTVIKALKVSYFEKKDLYPFFWYSHNAHIPGYINELSSVAGIHDKFGEILNDSMECMFPQKWLRPLKIMEDSREVFLQPSNYLSVIWGQAALDGVRAAALSAKSNLTQDAQITELLKLKKLSDEAKQTGEWTGILPENTPTWSHGDEFISIWPKDLLP